MARRQPAERNANMHSKRFCQLASTATFLGAPKK